jgi:hypothetical protein
MTDTKPNPQGVIAIITSPDGRVVATADDFNEGDSRAWETQRLRAARAVYWKLLRAYCNPVVVDAVEAFDCQMIVEKLLRQRNPHRLTYRAVGWPEDVAREIER